MQHDYDLEVRFGRRLRQLREEVGSSQQAIADTVNGRLDSRWHQTTIAKTEAAQRPIRLREADALAGAFGYSLAEVLAQLDDPDAATFADDLARRAALLEVDAMIASLRERAEHLRAHLGPYGDLNRWLAATGATPNEEETNGQRHASS